MASTARARTTRRRIRIRWFRVLLLAVVAAAIGVAVGLQSSGSPSTPGASAARAPAASPAAASPASAAEAPLEVPPRDLGETDGAVPDGTTVFDDGVPGVAHLDPLLLAALRRAANDAAIVGVRFTVDSGWRSPAYQQGLLQEAISTYGSEEEAAKWVATPQTSAHVSGDAVDLGRGAAAWLSEHGAGYGLCQIYGNESWHYELRPDAAADGCPPTYADPTQDPRMQG